VEAQVLIGHPPLVITRLAEDLDASLMVSGSHGLDATDRIFMGYVAQAALSQAPCDVLLPALTLWMNNNPISNGRLITAPYRDRSGFGKRPTLSLWELRLFSATGHHARRNLRAHRGIQLSA